MKIKYLILASFLILSCMLPFASSSGIPSFPHEFLGTVTVNEESAPDGTTVSAAVDGKIVATNIQNPVETVNGNYGIDGLPLLVQGLGLSNGDEIRFFVDGIDTEQTFIFQVDGGPTWMNLTVTIEEDDDDDDDDDTTPPSPQPPSQNPTARHGGPYTGFVGVPVQFDGSASTAVSGRTITSYSWTFGDGSIGSGARPQHTYTTAGIYTVRLTVTDSQGATGSAATIATITVQEMVKIEASQEVLDQILQDYNINLTEPFYAIDTTGDGKVDNFIDPNNLIYLVRKATVEGDVIFLLSTQDGDMPMFFWNSETDEIVPITAIEAELSEPIVDTQKKEITFTITVEKADWIYIKVIDSYPPDEYPDFTLTVTTADGRVISSDMIWREDGFIYILDDPDVQYLLIYGYDELPADLVPPEPEPEPEPAVGIPLWIIIIGLIALIIIIIVAVFFKTGYLYIEKEDKDKKKPGKK